MISPGWMITLFIITEILVWDIIKTSLKTIRHCATAKAYGKVVAQNNMMIRYEDFQEAIHNKTQNKEVTQNGNKQDNGMG